MHDPLRLTEEKAGHDRALFLIIGTGRFAACPFYLALCRLSRRFRSPEIQVQTEIQLPDCSKLGAARIER